MTIKTLAMRKAEAVAAKTAAVETLCVALAKRGAELGGRYILYGSAARGELRRDSDVDLLLEFPSYESSRLAWDFAEETCAALGLPHDIRPVEWTSEKFLAHVLPKARSLP